MGILSGFAPWLVYWVLVGNVPFAVAVVVALALALGSLAVRRAGGKHTSTLEIGSSATFLVLAVLTFTMSQSFLERWIQPLGTAGFLIVALAGALMGRPFVREFAQVDQRDEVVKSEHFAGVTAMVTWVWIGTFAGMTVSAAVPPIVLRNASILDTGSVLSIACYWVIPFVLLGSAALSTRLLLERMVAAALSPDVVRRTTFVAFRELGIDELLYLAKEKADREVGAGMEAYAVQIGSMGVPLTGDESRESWPATYKVRESR